ncbi:MAG TPA: YtxH domain-containing protein [Paludibacter sp.]|nr:YtxH domain-containing protein [Paludibacter sp.]
MSSGKVVLGVIAGATTGALLGILYAPTRGAITRRSICLKDERDIDGLKINSMNLLTRSLTGLKK